MRIKINLKHISYTIAILLLIFLSFHVYEYLKPIKSIHYLDRTYAFRDDIKAANKIPVYPNEKVLHDLFWHYSIKNITILFKPMDTKTNAHYQVEVFELTYKLWTMYHSQPIIKFEKNFNAEPIETYENITREEGVLKIILVPSQFTNETYVRAGGNKVYIYGKDFRGLDLATIKTILVALGVEV